MKTIVSILDINSEVVKWSVSLTTWNNNNFTKCFVFVFESYIRVLSRIISFWRALVTVPVLRRRNSWARSSWLIVDVQVDSIDSIQLKFFNKFPHLKSNDFFYFRKSSNKIPTRIAINIKTRLHYPSSTISRVIDWLTAADILDQIEKCAPCWQTAENLENQRKKIKHLQQFINYCSNDCRSSTSIRLETKSCRIS